MEIKNYNFQDQDSIPIIKTNNNSIPELVIERKTIDLENLRTFSNDTLVLTQPIRAKSAIKTIPVLPEHDTIEHPVFNVLEGNILFPAKPTFFDQFYFTPVDPSLKELHFDRIKIRKEKPQLSEKKVVIIAPEKGDYVPKTYSESSNGFASTDWMLGVIVVALIIFGWLRVGYSRYFQNAIQASYDYFTARRIFEEANVTRSRVFYFMNLLFFINLALFLTQYLEYNRIYIIGLHGVLQFFLCLGLIIAVYSVKSLILYLFDYLFLSKNGFASYVFTVFLYNKIVGFLLLPIISVLPYVPNHITPWLFLVGASIFIIFYVFRVFKGLQICFKNRLSIFYLILYLCTLEILPVVILIKLVLR